MNKIKLLCPTLAAVAVSVICASAQGAIVRNDVDYQYFRDFAENKGAFRQGASNVNIYNKQGQYVGTMLPNVPMPDLAVTNRRQGVATLFHPQYVTSVKHISGYYGEVQYGDDGNNPDNHHFNYLVVEQNNHPGLDFQTPRLHKLVTEVAPIPVNVAESRQNGLLDKSRYPYFVRVGAGIQKSRNQYGQNSNVADYYQYLIGGTPMRPVSSDASKVQFDGNLFNDGLSTYGLPGDSGSPLFVYDAKEKRWELAGNLATYYGEGDSRNDYTVAQNQYMTNAVKDDEIDFPIRAKTIYWKGEDASSSKLKLADPAKKHLDTGTERPSLANGKTAHFSGVDGSEIVLQSSINQGAGALYFNNNMTVRAEKNNDTWTGAGVVVNGNKTVNWQVKNPQGDRLSKLGTGTLLVNGKGKNLGDISVGEGTVVLDQKAENGQQQAFNQVGITSGRGTVVLANDKQVNPNNIYFGFRGGRLDLNGNALSFNYIQNADDGAKIVNHNKDKTASITIGKDLTENELEWVNWSKKPETALGIYEYINTHRNNRTDYFRLKPNGNPNQYFPLDQNSSNDWEFLGSSKAEAIKKMSAAHSLATFSGTLGETDNTRPNGGLNVTFNPSNSNNLLLLNGGANLNGNLNVEKGSVVLSGAPVAHAYDYLRNKEVVRENEWTDRQFTAREFNVAGNAKLESGRNVSQLNGNFNAKDQGQIKLGFVQGESKNCMRSTHTGETKCENNAVLSQSVFNQLPTTKVTGNVNLQNQSQFQLGKAHLVGRINADKQTQVTLKPESQWTLTGNSNVGNLALSNTLITLNQRYDEIGNNHKGNINFNELAINGNLTGTGSFRFLTNVAERRGDHIVVNGLANGAFQLSLKNTGAEPNEISPLSLVKLNNPGQNNANARFTLENGYVDLGAYRYILANNNNDYRLYNPLRDAQVNHGASTQTQELSREEYEAVQRQIKAKQRELNSLNVQYERAKRQTDAKNAEVNRLQNTVNQTDAKLKNVVDQYNAVSQNQKAKRNYLYRQYTQLINTLKQQNNRLSTAKNVAAELLKTQTNATNLVAKLRQDITSLEASKAPRKGNVDKARELCEAQGVSHAVCSKVLRIANTSDLTRFENELDIAIQRLENAEKALALATNDGDAQAIAYAKEAVENASKEVLTSLENNYESLSEIEQFLATQSQTVSAPVQAALVSRYSNTALSEMSANVNMALQIGRNLDRHLLSQDSSNVWVNTESTKQSYHSDFYRPYKQTLTLTQIGVANDVNDNVRVGAVLSHSRASNTFDENVSGKNRLTALSTYVKGNWNNGVFASLDLGYGRSRNTIDFDGKNVFHRSLFSAGVNAGIQWDWGINVQPSVGVRYNRLSKANYQLAEAKIESKALNLMTYRAGLELNKTFDVAGVKLTPSLASYYNDATQRKMAVNGALSVNDIGMQQQFGRYFNHEAGLAAQFNQWQVSAQVGMLKGSDITTQKYAAFKLGYTW
jgi:igA-specific serine endopeptidase